MAAAINPFLLAGGILSALAALAHLGCIAFGPSWYRFFGAGERMARMAEAGQWQAGAITLAVTAVLALWSLYALSGAGMLPRLPLLRLALCAVAGVYLLRGLAFVPLMARIPGNSLTFWLVSSGICLTIGAIHAIGLRQEWARL
ncbi:hypothetical protein [Lysobacter silvisoli]|uniref:Uncharacterized protein n=1 Tax=Lysobacter silvisoli TaxID=2293254 RepID=A0A371K1C9_9GAMM|nr:hypothetical protein [Lysobacter silvisoli]RDZ27733.1 hypothetical protein DX914_00705 [Lysobacter silvisoli]